MVTLSVERTLSKPVHIHFLCIAIIPPVYHPRTFPLSRPFKLSPRFLFTNVIYQFCVRQFI